MGRKRERASGMGLLPRMEAIVGKTVTSFRYHPIGGKPIPLGRDRADAIRKVLDLEGRAPDAGTLAAVWTSYKASPRFRRLAQATRDDYEQCWVAINPVLGRGAIGKFTSIHIAKYIRVERADAPSRANHEKALLSNLFAHGIDLGLCTDNPARVVRPNPEEPRTEAPQPALLARFVAWAMKDRPKPAKPPKKPPTRPQIPQYRVITLAARFAAATGSRKVEFMDLAWPQVDLEAGVLRLRRAKQRGRKRGEIVDAIDLSPALRQCFVELAALRETGRLAVFPTRDGGFYSDSGFKTAWQRLMMAAIGAGVLCVEERFTFHDLRAYYVTEHKRVHDRLPDIHTNPATTASTYDRNKVVKRRAI